MNEGGPAFMPVSLRDYFAAAALTGLLVTTGMKAAGGDLTSGENESICNDARTCGWGSGVANGMKNEDGSEFTWLEMIADEAYSVADAMLRERNRGAEPDTDTSPDGMVERG